MYERKIIVFRIADLDKTGLWPKRYSPLKFKNNILLSIINLIDGETIGIAVSTASSFNTNLLAKRFNKTIKENDELLVYSFKDTGFFADIIKNGEKCDSFAKIYNTPIKASKKDNDKVREEFPELFI